MFGFDLTLILGTVLALAVSGAAGLADWLLNHLGLVFFLLVGKSLLLTAPGLFKREATPSHCVKSVLIILADAARNGVFLYIFSLLLSGLFSGSLFDFIFQFFAVVVGGAILFLVSEGPMYFVYDMLDCSGPANEAALDNTCFWICIGLEAFSTAAMTIAYLILRS